MSQKDKNIVNELKQLTENGWKKVIPIDKDLKQNTKEVKKTVPSFNFKIIEAGQRLVQKGYKISIRNICKNNEIDEGNIVVVYIKYLNRFLEAGQRRVQKEFKVSIRDICENNNIKEGDIIIIYIKKTNIKSTKGKN